MKQQINARLSDSAREKLESLAARYGTQTTALEVAIDRLYQMEQGQQRWTSFEHKSVKDNLIRVDLIRVDVIDEQAYQAAVRGLPSHEYSGKPHRSDFLVWSGFKQDLPAAYKTEYTEVRGELAVAEGYRDGGLVVVRLQLQGATEEVFTTRDSRPVAAILREELAARGA
jgi:hypothetical protein